MYCYPIYRYPIHRPAIFYEDYAMKDSFDRELVRGSLDLMVLSVLTDGPSYGYLIQKEVIKASAGLIDLKAGTLYPLLHRLEGDGWVKGKLESSVGRKRKWYRLTASGKRQLRSRASQWLEYAKCVRRLLNVAFDGKVSPSFQLG